MNKIRMLQQENTQTIAAGGILQTTISGIKEIANTGDTIIVKGLVRLGYKN
jgi:hypothetical protein